MPTVGKLTVRKLIVGKSDAREAIGKIANDEEQHPAGSYNDAVQAGIQLAAHITTW